MSKIIFNEEELETLKAACDVILRNSGIAKLKEIAAFVEKLECQDNDFSFLDMKLIQQLCDISLKTSGVLVLKNVITLLNKTVETNK